MEGGARGTWGSIKSLETGIVVSGSIEINTLKKRLNKAGVIVD